MTGPARLSRTLDARRATHAWLVGLADDPHLDALEAACRAREVHVVRLNSRAPLGLDFDLDQDIPPGGRSLARVGALIIRTAPPRAPGRRLDGPLDQEAWRTLQRACDVERDVLPGLSVALFEQGARVANPARGGAFVENKPEQLLVARRVGLRTPATRITRDRARAEDFMARCGGRLVVKPVRGGAYARRITRPERLHEVVQSGPHILQEEIEGAHLRVVALDGAVLSAVAIEATGTLDFRRAPAFLDGSYRLTPHPLDPSLVGKLAALQRALTLPFCGIDLVAGPAGVVFLEANGAPAYLEQERKTGHAITAALADWIAQGVRERPRDNRR